MGCAKTNTNNMFKQQKNTQLLCSFTKSYTVLKLCPITTCLNTSQTLRHY